MKVDLKLEPLSRACVESFYDGSHSGTERQCLRALCESHERLRGEIASLAAVSRDALAFLKHALEFWDWRYFPLSQESAEELRDKLAAKLDQYR